MNTKFTLMEQQIEQEKARQDQASAREQLVSRICTTEALERLNRVKLVKPELVETVEIFIEQQARSGKLRNKISEAELMSLLNKLGSTAREEKINIVRKRYGNEDDDEDDSDLM